MWAKLGPIWQDLLTDSKEFSAFLSYPWIDACFKAAHGATTATGYVWRAQSGAPVGCVMLWRASSRLGPFPVTSTLLNSPGIVGLAPEHNDIIAVNEYRAAVTADLRKLLWSQQFDQLDLQGVRARLFHELQASWPREYWNGFASSSPFVDLNATRAADGDYLSRLSGNTRSRIRKSFRILTKHHGEPQISVARDPSIALSWFDELLDLHDRRWESLETPSGFTESARTVHRAMIRSSCAGDPLDGVRADIVRVTAGDKVIGLLYHLIRGGHVHFVQSGINYDVERQVKPGLVCHALSVQSCIDEGFSIYDFLGGESEPPQYKRSLSTDSAALYWSQLPAATVRMDLMHGLRVGRRSIRDALSKLR